jgi:hypothetical protein
LTPAQAQRLEQISLHYRGTGSFYDAEVRKALRLTDEQVDRIRTVGSEQYSTWNRQAGTQFHKDKDFTAYQKKLAANLERRNQEQLAVLTGEQQAKWRQMLGDPFKGPIPSPTFVMALAQPPLPQVDADGKIDEASAVARLARTVEALALEVAKLNEEVRRLREENDKLRKERGPAMAARFRDRGDHVEDTQTGLLWQKDGDASGVMNYFDALKYATNQKFGGIYGWRVPTRDELRAIFPAVEPPFEDTKYNKTPYGKGPGEHASYWTADLDTRLPDYAYLYHWYGDGGANNCIASRNLAYVRCVHDPVKK